MLLITKSDYCCRDSRKWMLHSISHHAGCHDAIISLCAEVFTLPPFIIVVAADETKLTTLLTPLKNVGVSPVIIEILPVPPFTLEPKTTK
jgi:hypothetical protein